jgi:hypothetical protein
VSTGGAACDREIAASAKMETGWPVPAVSWAPLAARSWVDGPVPPQHGQAGKAGRRVAHLSRIIYPCPAEPAASFMERNVRRSRFGGAGPLTTSMRKPHALLATVTGAILAIGAVVALMIAFRWLPPPEAPYGPPPVVTAQYDIVSLNSSDDGKSFDTILFTDANGIPLSFTVHFPNGDRLSLAELTHDVNRIRKLMRPDHRVGESWYCSRLTFSLERAQVTNVYVTSNIGGRDDGITLECDGRTLPLPMSRSEMEAIFGNHYKLTDR